MQESQGRENSVCKGPAEQNRLVGVERTSRPVQTNKAAVVGDEMGERRGQILGPVGPGEDFESEPGGSHAG